jgi:hypothetical protein
MVGYGEYARIWNQVAEAYFKIWHCPGIRLLRLDDNFEDSREFG